MLVQSHDSGDRVERPGLSLVEDAWAMEVVPRLPANLAEQALALKALQRVRSMATPHDLLRGVLADVLGPLSVRRLGAWAVLVGGAEIAEAAWRQRLRARSPWLLWLLRALVATSEVPDPLGGRPRGRLLLVDASGLGQPGGTGDDWRLHLAYDVTAGRLGQVQGTDRRGGEPLGRYQWQARDVMVADRGSGSRRSVALAVRQQAEVGLRLPPAPCPLETEAGQPCAVLRWLRQPGETTRDGHGWWRWQGQRSRVRLIAAQRDPATARKARRRQGRKAPPAGRTITAPTLAVAGWLLVITPLAAATWSPTDGLSLYRARWPVELVLKKMTQRLHLNQLRSKPLTRVEATVRALRMAWAWHADPPTLLRTLLSASTPPEMTVVRRWLLSGLGLDTLRQQGQGSWSEARLQAGLPR
jgi:Transposase DDE domain